MHNLLQILRNLVGGLGHRESVPGSGNGDTDWMPPVMGPADWSNHYIVAMADRMIAMTDRDAGWYVDRRTR
ncbi:MAG TPA: hypothetical protein VGM59_12800 [Dongiaceae bacterium]|jgi:hypothetical protein